jgi:Adaptin N terminal region
VELKMSDSKYFTTTKKGEASFGPNRHTSKVKREDFDGRFSGVVECSSVAATGEIHEFKEELRTLDRSKRKDAVKKVIAAMTVGKDVSMLFPDVVNCMQTDDLELKKLVYLYLINYAKTQPDLAIMGVNTFVKVRCCCATRLGDAQFAGRRAGSG